MGRPSTSTCPQGHVKVQQGGRLVCLECKNTHTKEWRNRNPEKTIESHRKSSLKSSFGLTPEQYAQRWKEQKGLCAACEEPLPEKENGDRFPPVDHDHLTGKIRGIVHTKCNRGMGLFNDNPDRMRKVADYIERNK
jgi:hypothetical protein